MRALLFFLLVLLLFGVIMMISKRMEMARRRAQQDEVAAEKSERMVACATCGVHVPESSACQQHGQRYCPEHCPK
ncbi:uncharacterized protein SAMN05443662_0386 [Sulfurivirga caldicuralii]|uniref:Uncharacterized protein n=1 Tax=Sulfurivirga caldicuralii TaxID=364032 RepID=A0A1N6DSS5_9GAMM|nr:PP0621 family protein [Sulfurivirga caldicuralii]SIN73744.1 uncharacterized protein SAMN05443662_0386 [Sulfurivirga caldicuralii]